MAQSIFPDHAITRKGIPIAQRQIRRQIEMPTLPYILNGCPEDESSYLQKYELCMSSIHANQT
ncbi:MAG TPA: hypothetical protein PK004_10520, partial [Smithella sp.]|nr:hypothetical protein [Smithella sp.]